MPIDRRTFLASGAAAAIASIASADPLKLGPLEPPSEKPVEQEPPADPYDKRLGIALVGIGHVALQQIIPAFAQSKHAKLAALVSGHRDKAMAVAASSGVDPKRIYDYAGYDKIKDDPAIDAVYIALPNTMHAEYTIRAAAAGKHVLCEKPMATSSADCEKMIAACKQANKQLMIAYRVQYEPHHRYVMKAARDKRFGKIKLIEGHNGQNTGDPTQWRLKPGSGSLMDVGIYCLNTCRFVLGEEPIWVQATQFSTPSEPNFKQVDELTLFQLGFPSGALGSFSSSFGTHESRRYRVLGDNGSWIDMDPAFGYAGLALTVSEIKAGQEQREKIELAQKQQFALELDHFASCVRANRTPYTPGEEGLQDIRLIEAIVAAARDGSRRELPRIDKRDAFRGTPPEVA